MLIASIIILVIAFSFFIPKRYLKSYYVFSAFILSMLFFFATPNGESDLYRYFHFLKNIRGISWTDILRMEEKNYSNEFSDLYIPRYLIFCIYSKLMSYLPERFYVIPISMFVYTIPLGFVFRECDNGRKGSFVLGYSFYLITIDFVSISAMRNIFVAMAFCYVLYEELIKKSNKILCWICYGALCLIHSYAFILILIRFLLIISSKYSKYLICFIIAFTQELLLLFESFLHGFIGKLGEGTITSLLSFAVSRGLEYFQYISDDRWKLKILSLFFYLLTIIFSWLYLCMSTSIKRPEQEGYRKLLVYYVYFLVFTISSYSQYDIFIRGAMVIMPITGVFASRYFNEFVDIQGNRIVFQNKKSIVLFIVLCSLMGVIFLFNIRFNYNWINEWWR